MTTDQTTAAEREDTPDRARLRTITGQYAIEHRDECHDGNHEPTCAECVGYLLMEVRDLVHDRLPSLDPQATIRDVVDAIDRQTEVIRSLFAWEEPPEEALARVKAAQEDESSEAELADWERELIEQSTDPAWNPRNAQGYDLLRSALNAASIDAKASTADHDLVAMLLETSQGIEVLRRLDRMSPPVVTPLTQNPATDAPEATQTLADLTPRLGDRVRVRYCDQTKEVTYGWREAGGYCWRYNGRRHYVTLPTKAVVLTHLDPVTPEEPPVGAGMLVDREGDLWRRTEGGWQWLNEGHWTDCAWSSIREYWRPATPADLARHGVGEDGEPTGKAGERR